MIPDKNAKKNLGEFRVKKPNGIKALKAIGLRSPVNPQGY
jgi:hypothetical protein